MTRLRFISLFFGSFLFLSNATGSATTTLCREFENFQETCEEPDGEECEDQFIQEKATKQGKDPNDIRNDIQKKLKKCDVSGGSSGGSAAAKAMGTAAAGLGVVGAGFSVAQKAKEFSKSTPTPPPHTIIERQTVYVTVHANKTQHPRKILQAKRRRSASESKHSPTQPRRYDIQTDEHKGSSVSKRQKILNTP